MQIRIAVDGGSCLGTIYHNGKAKVLIVDNVAVDEDKRRQGIGTALMEKAVAIAKEFDVDSVELTVRSDNDAAKALYRKLGFERTDHEYHRLILRRFD